MPANGVIPSTWSISYTRLALARFLPLLSFRNSFSDIPIVREQAAQSMTKRILPVAGFSSWRRIDAMNTRRDVSRQIGRRLPLISVRSLPSVMPVTGLTGLAFLRGFFGSIVVSCFRSCTLRGFVQVCQYLCAYFTSQPKQPKSLCQSRAQISAASRGHQCPRLGTAE